MSLPMIQDSLTVAVAQMRQHPCADAAGLEAAWARIAAWAQRARGQGVDLLVLPELILSGYHLGADRLAALSQPPEAVAQRLGDIARESRIALVCGYPERLAAGGVANAAILVDEQGQTLLNYRKTHLFGSDEAAVFTPGDLPQHSQVALWRGWRFGLLICYDVEFADNVRALAQAGADAVLVPTANMQGYEAVPQLLLPARAYESQVALAYANTCGAETRPGSAPEEASATLHYGGLSTLAWCDGSAVWADAAQEELLCATWRRADLLASRLRHPFLQNARRRV
ncbi:nitrilase-related carbon-nitrogen hydrolase [Amphibiibacter pelophylacis]|uniref:Nitrilase-related carbon-nitrogen hydrolase n=1 Tax=Amphibiibacter pelophylacis TaxID=1799477 RepID=A0ACC6NYW4_9BURK